MYTDNLALEDVLSSALLGPQVNDGIPYHNPTGISYLNALTLTTKTASHMLASRITHRTLVAMCLDFYLGGGGAIRT